MPSGTHIFTPLLYSAPEKISFSKFWINQETFFQEEEFILNYDSKKLLVEHLQWHNSFKHSHLKVQILL